MTRGLPLLAAVACIASAAPEVANPSFEAKAYTTWPGLARQHGGQLPGWQFTGNVGVNPVFEKRPNGKPAPRHAFSDNGRTPHGRQVAFMQNEAKLSQRVPGFEKGKTYRVFFFENGRHNHAPNRNPRLKVTLGGEVVVSEHAVPPVEVIEQRDVPYARVESAPFTAPADGAYDLVFETTFGDRVAVLLDRVEIKEIENP